MKNSLFLLVLLSVFLACQKKAEIQQPEIRRVSAKDFGDEEKVAVKLADGFELKLWAPGPLLANAVAISFDNDGVAYVAETSRRKSSDLDIREHRDWMTEDLGLESIEDSEAFHKRKLDPALSSQNTWMEDFNKDGSHDYLDLMEQTEYIRRVWDSDGDGRADASSIFANDFDDLLTGVAAGVLYHNQEVYLTAAPDLWKLQDTNGDGVADVQRSISKGYGIHIAYAGHDMSGLTVGPDGRIYWSIGDMGVNTVDDKGRRWAYPHEGAVMRINPDGTGLEVFAHGLRNPQELAFDAYGNLISVDNDGDHAGEHERFVHILEGSDSGWRIYWQFGKYNEPNEEYKIWMDEQLSVPHFEGQAAYLLPPLALAPDGPAGLAYNPGTAFGKGWENHFFGSYFTGSSARSKIQAFKLKPRGASFEIEKTEDIATGIVSTGIAFGPDGALYINDWLDGYALKEQGRIWKLDVKSTPHPLRNETKEILKAGMQEQSTTQLAKWLAHPDMRVRMAAQFELVERHDPKIFTVVVQSANNEFARLHAVWGLGQLARKDRELGKLLLPALDHTDEQVRAQAAKVLGEAQYAAAAQPLIQQLEDSSVPAQYYAIEALGKLGYKKAFDSLVALLEQVGDSDPHLRHGLVYALSKLDREAELIALHQHPSPDVRIGAVVALRHKRSAGLAEFLADEAPLVALEAARAIHDDTSVPDALPQLARSLNESSVKNEAFLRRAINANLRIGDEASAGRLAIFIGNPSNPAPMRADAMWALGYWSAPPVLDRVEGRYRKVLARPQLKEAQATIQPIIPQLLVSPIVEIKAAAAALIGRVQLVGFETQLLDLLENKRQPAEVRTAALEALAKLESEPLERALNVALTSDQEALRQKAQSLLGKLDLDEATVVQMLSKALDNGTSSERQEALMSLSTKKSAEAEALMSQWLQKLIDGQISPELQLDVINAVEKSSFEKLKSAITTYEQSKDQNNALDLYRESLYGGNARRGGRIFYQNNSAQCIRCHQYQGMGGEVGPDLTKIATVLNREQLLESLIEPSERIAPGYGSVILGLKNEQKINGILLEENDDFITIRNVDGDTQQIAKAEIAERENAPSGMFSMKGILSKSEIRDLIAFLVSLK